MLVHQNHTSEGTGAASVNINDRSISNSRASGTCHSGVRVGSDGVLYKIQANGGFSAIMSEWLLFGAASNFYVQRTIVSGTLQVDAGSGWLQCNANRDFDNQKSTSGLKTTVVFLEFADDAVGTTVFDSATLTFESEQGTL